MTSTGCRCSLVWVQAVLAAVLLLHLATALLLSGLLPGTNTLHLKSRVAGVSAGQLLLVNVTGPSPPPHTLHPPPGALVSALALAGLRQGRRPLLLPFLVCLLVSGMVDLLDLFSLLSSDWRLGMVASSARAAHLPSASLAWAQLEVLGLQGLPMLYSLLVARLLVIMVLARTLLNLYRGDPVPASSPTKRGPEEGCSVPETKEKEPKIGRYMRI